MKRIHPLYLILGAAFGVLILAFGAGAWYGYNRITELTQNTVTLSNHLTALELALSSTTVLLKEDIEQAQAELATAIDQEKQNLNAQLGNVQQTVGTISGAVNTLEKLSKTDPELLQKYSKVFFLNEHYAPERVIQIPDSYEYYEERNLQVHAGVWSYLERLLNQAKQDGMSLYLYSAYRPFDEQSALKDQYTVVYGAGTANQFSADQGYSEHQLGTTVDLITTGLGGQLKGFEGTPAYQWLLTNAHRYGFTLSYSEGNGYYVFEPWHWRFVGVALATHLHSTNQHFYDLDQREIDEYLVNIFD
jgi:LAS superfamily LD-carboxypeptidase LdcB